MIIKSISIKSKTGIRRLLKYIFRDTPFPPEKHTRRKYIPSPVRLTKQDVKHLLQETEDAKLLQAYYQFSEKSGSKNPGEFAESLIDSSKKPFIVRKNLREGRTLESMIAELESNEEERIHRRVDSVVLQHVIISFKPADTGKLSDKALYKIANEFCRIRGEHIKIVGAKHAETDHVHIHLAVAGVANGYSTRVSRNTFASIKTRLQSLQKELYPSLESLPDHGRKQRLILSGQKEVAYVYKKNDERAKSKNHLFAILDAAHGNSRTIDQFFERIGASGVEPYYRSGRLTGFIYQSLKFRISRLEYTEKIEGLVRKQEQETKDLRELKSIRQGNRQERSNFRSTPAKVAAPERQGQEDKDLADLKAIRQGRVRSTEAFKTDPGNETQGKELTETENKEMEELKDLRNDGGREADDDDFDISISEAPDSDDDYADDDRDTEDDSDTEDEDDDESEEDEDDDESEEDDDDDEDDINP